MKIAGLEKLSLVDFPGHLALTVFVQGCNFRCPYCQNPDLVTCEKHFEYIKESVVIELAVKKKKLLEGIVISGGEPILSADLSTFLKKIKRELGLKVKLDTNGSNPEKLEELLRERLLDYVALDIKTSFPKYHLVTSESNVSSAVARSIFLVMLSTTPYEFRTTCVPGIVDEEDIRLIAKLVKGAKKYCFQQFRPVVTYDKSFQKVKPYPKETLQKFQKILADSVKKVEIRGV